MSSELNTLDNLLKEKIEGKVVLVRVDLNVPMKNGKITDFTRINGVLPTICKLVSKKAKIVLISHFGRPEGFDMSQSLASVVDELSNRIEEYSNCKTKIHFGVDCIGLSAAHAIENLQNGEIVLLENLRFYKEEEANNKEFAKKLASKADYYVNDAFSCSHRAHASISGVTEFLPSYAGVLLEQEVTSLKKSFEAPKKPFAAVVGGSKISSKIDILTSLSKRADYIFIGGAMANTFLNALGHNVAKSLCEKDMAAKAKQIIADALKNNCKIILPSDVVVAKAIDDKFNTRNINIKDIKPDEMILDAGFETLVDWFKIIAECKTIIWNGPIGAFEFEPFNNSSVALCRAVAKLTSEGKIYSVAGGGDTLSLLTSAGVRDAFSYVSTAGGAFLEWLEGKDLPGIAALVNCKSNNTKKIA